MKSLNDSFLDSSPDCVIGARISPSRALGASRCTPGVGMLNARSTAEPMSPVTAISGRRLQLDEVGDDIDLVAVH